MAGEKTQIEIDAQIDAGIKVNGNKEITPPIHNAIEKALSNSYVNKKDGGKVMQSLFGQSTYIAPTDDEHYTPKKYVSDLFNSTVFQQGGNSFTAAAVLGTNDIYDLLFETNNVSRQLIDSTGRFGFGTTSLSASTHKTNKSQGNTGASWAEKWLDSDDALIASIDNNGTMDAIGGYNINGANALRYYSSGGNVSVGNFTGDITLGSDNLRVGAGSMNNITSSANANTAFGTSTLAAGTDIAGMTALGTNSFSAATVASAGLAAGVNSGQYWVDGSYGVFLGPYSGVPSGLGSLSAVIAIGGEAVARANNQLVFGSVTGPAYDVFFGKGQGNVAGYATAGSPISIHSQGDIASASNSGNGTSFLQLRGTRGYGNYATNAGVKIQYAPALGSGSTLQSWSDAFSVDGSTGKATFSQVVNLSLANYASNALALAGGLAVGDLYRTAGVVMIVT
jgi:hypothetical protein